MTDDARAFWVKAPGHGEIWSEPLPLVSGTDVVVRAMFSAVSRGTESLVFNGRFGASAHEIGRAHV